MVRCSTVPFDRPRSQRDPDHDLVCGAWGPLQGPGDPARCQVQAGHRGPHIAYDDDGTRQAEWATAYTPLEDLAGDVIYTLPPEGARGPLPQFYARHPDWLEIRDAYLAGDWEAFCRENGYGLHAADAIEGDLETEATPTPSPDVDPPPQPAADAQDGDASPLAGVTRVDELDHPGIPPPCIDARPELERLTTDACLAIWDHGGMTHVCERADEHHDMGRDRLDVLEPHHETAPHRCRCFCGTVTRSTTQGPLEPTSRPEAPLTPDTGDPP